MLAWAVRCSRTVDCTLLAYNAPTSSSPPRSVPALWSAPSWQKKTQVPVSAGQYKVRPASLRHSTFTPLKPSAPQRIISFSSNV